MTQAISQLPNKNRKVLNFHGKQEDANFRIMITLETSELDLRTSLLCELIDQQSFTIRPAYTTVMTQPSIASRTPFKEEPETQNEQLEAEEQEELQYDPQFWNSIFSDYTFSELLTESESSLIWLGIGPDSPQRIVLKITQRFQSVSSRSIHQREEKEFLQKIRIKQMVDIKKIIDQEEYRLIVMKYYPWTVEDLSQKALSYSKKRYTQSHFRFIVFIFKAILQAVNELHESGFVHRDLKLDNIMVDAQFNVYLNDFELVTRENQIDQSLAGTIDYMPPERLAAKKRMVVPIRRQVDIWSLGILLYQLCTGVTPYHGSSAEELEQQIYSKNVQRQQIPTEFMKLIQGMLSIRPEKRLTIAQILSSPIFVSEISKQELNKWIMA